jgi:hypothetical protein
MKKIDLFVYVAHNDNGPTPNQYFFFFGEVGKVSCSFKTSPNVMSKGFYFFSREFLTLWFVEQSRHSPSYITAGHFDAVPGELRLKAFETRLMTTFLAICLRSVWSSVDAARRTADLELCTVLATQASNWSLDMERFPIYLDFEQASRLHESGVANLAFY